jgi:ribosomal protein S7
LVKSIKIRKEKNLFLKINNELYDTFNSTGNSLKKKGDYYKNISLFKTIKKFKW